MDGAAAERRGAAPLRGSPVRHPLSIVVAVAENGVIGRDNRLIWRLKTDLRRFRDLTWGKPIIMGRKTFESIGRPLPGRANVVLSRDPGFAAPGVHRAAGWDAALETAGRLADETDADGIAVIGGAAVFALALPLAARLHLTRVKASPEGDVLFPGFDASQFQETFRRDYPSGADDEFAFTVLDLQRRAPALSR